MPSSSSSNWVGCWPLKVRIFFLVFNYFKKRTIVLLKLCPSLSVYKGSNKKNFTVLLFFWFNNFLEAREEIEKFFRSFFGGIEDKKKFFWNFLTFNSSKLNQRIAFERWRRLFVPWLHLSFFILWLRAYCGETQCQFLSFYNTYGKSY